MIAVLGAGESGIGVALLATRKGWEVFVSESGKITDNFKRELQENKIPFEEGGHTFEKIRAAKQVIKSPGIPPHTAILKRIAEAGIPLLGEIEFAYRECRGRIIGITGSNGKTTTTNLTHHLLVSAGINAVKCGNIGVSFARTVAEREPSHYVVELSSFQLEDIIQFRPDTAVITNISPDHLDRYGGDIATYAEAKFRIGMNQQSSDKLIHGALAPSLRTHLYHRAPLAQKIKVGAGESDVVQIEGTSLFRFDNPSLRGRHNAQNASCAVAAARLEGIDVDTLKSGVNSFVNDPHRMQEVCVVHGVRYINDSKATNVDAVYFALEALKPPVIWIAGGIDKGNDYSQLYPLLSGRVKALICLGKDNRNLVASFKGRVSTIRETASMKEALRQARLLAEEGDTILLSPACSSFDLFDNYIHRGEVFTTLAQSIERE